MTIQVLFPGGHAGNRDEPCDERRAPPEVIFFSPPPTSLLRLLCLGPLPFAAFQDSCC